ncbi:MAG: PP0621 family protein [Pseudomonadota bacterium]|nr:PP0621 family protein [Pseudomonadota bacterium]
MAKLLVLIAVIAAVYWWFFKKPSALGSSTNKPSDDGQDSQHTLQACRYCDVNVPVSEGVLKESQFFCCEEHANAFLEKQNQQ